MSTEPSADDLVARIDGEVDGIDGLVAAAAGREGVVALVASRWEVRRIRADLVRLGVPPGRLVVQVIEDALIPYPVTDPRLRCWMEHSDEAPTVMTGTREKAPELRMTPGGIAKLVVGGGVALYVLSIIAFVLLMMVERWME